MFFSFVKSIGLVIDTFNTDYKSFDQVHIFKNIFVVILYSHTVKALKRDGYSDEVPASSLTYTEVALIKEIHNATTHFAGVHYWDVAKIKDLVQTLLWALTAHAKSQVYLPEKTMSI